MAYQKRRRLTPPAPVGHNRGRGQPHPRAEIVLKPRVERAEDSPEVSSVPKGLMKLRLRSEGQSELRRVSLFVRATLRALIIVGLPILVLAPFDTLGSAAPHPQIFHPVAVTTYSSRLPAGSALRRGSVLASSGGRCLLDMQSDGNLVLDWEGHTLWSSRTSGHLGAIAVMQRDGNLVIYQRHRAIWSSGTAGGGSHPYYLLVKADGNVVVETPANRPIWQTGTSGSSIRVSPRSTRAGRSPT